MKFLLVIATDIESTRGLVIETLDYIQHSLQILEALAPLYGQSRFSFCTSRCWMFIALSYRWLFKLLDALIEARRRSNL